MAGHNQRGFVACTGPGNGAPGGGSVHCGCDLSIGAGFANGDFLESLPDEALEVRALQVQRNGEVHAGAFEVLDDRLHPFVQCAIFERECCVGEFIFEFGFERIVLVAQAYGAYAVFCCCNEDSMCCGGGDGVPDMESPAAPAVCARAHTQTRIGLIVEAVAGAESGFVGGFEHGFSFFNLLFEGFKAVGILVGVGRKAHAAFEDALEVVRATSSFGCKMCQGKGIVQVGIDICTNLPDDFLCGGVGIGGSASKAGAEAFVFGLGRGLEEEYVCAFWTPGRAGRPTVNAGGEDGVEEVSVIPIVARLDCLPGFFLELRCCGF